MAVAEHNAPDVHPLLLLSYDHPHFYILNSFNHRTKNKDEQGLFIYLLHLYIYPFDGYLEGKVSKPFPSFVAFY